MEIYEWMAKNMLPKKVDKVRVGGNGDGGYVIPAKSIEECDLFVCFGLGCDIHFEKQLVEKNKKVIAYDMAGCIEPWARQMKIVGYNDFKNIKEVEEAKKILLKMDIEGFEWNFFETLDVNHFCEKVNTLTFELHLTINPNKKPLSVLDKVIENYHVVHVHGNNFGNYIQDVPETLEITMVNKNEYGELNLDKQTYPIPNLDFKNTWSKDEMKLSWINNS